MTRNHRVPDTKEQPCLWHEKQIVTRVSDTTTYSRWSPWYCQCIACVTCYWHETSCVSATRPWTCLWRGKKTVIRTRQVTLGWTHLKAMCCYLCLCWRQQTRFWHETTNVFLTRLIRTCFCRKKTTFLLTRNYLQFLTRTHTLGWRHVIANVLSMYWCRQQTCFWHDTTNVFLTKPPVFLTRPHTIGKIHIMVNVLSMFDVSNFFYLSRCRCILKST